MGQPTMIFGNKVNMPDTDHMTQGMQGKTFGLSVKITAAILILLAVGGLFEAAARVAHLEFNPGIACRGQLLTFRDFTANRFPNGKPPI